MKKKKKKNPAQTYLQITWCIKLVFTRGREKQREPERKRKKEGKKQFTHERDCGWFLRLLVSPS